MTSIWYTPLESISHTIFLGFMQKVSAPSRGACVIKKLYIFLFSPRQRLKKCFCACEKILRRTHLLTFTLSRRRGVPILEKVPGASLPCNNNTHNNSYRVRATRKGGEDISLHDVYIANNIVEQMQIKSWLNGVLKGNGVVPKVFIKLNTKTARQLHE